ncbi:MAG: hypothetical protein QOD26_2246 [Betaproteobacteria bacterium]|jgi:hypothetical protein|nr:hypothetical protein [Betaproteobacteria bacterium]
MSGAVQWLAQFDPRTLLVGFAAIGVLLALPLEILALRRLARIRIVGGAFYFLLGAVFILLGVAAGLVAASLHGYKRLTHEQVAAKVTLRQLSERQYALTLEAPGSPPRHFDLRGDEWQIDARVLKWRPAATIAGFDTLYRLERISGRYGDIIQERTAARTVHALASDDAPVDLWEVAKRYHTYVPMVDALYGSGAYVPMAEGAEYTVTVSASGLVIRPGNDAARKAVGGWK